MSQSTARDVVAVRELPAISRHTENTSAVLQRLTRVVTAIHATRGRLDPSGAAAWVVRRSSIFDLGLSRRNPLWRASHCAILICNSCHSLRDLARKRIRNASISI